MRSSSHIVDTGRETDRVENVMLEMILSQLIRLSEGFALCRQVSRLFICDVVSYQLFAMRCFSKVRRCSKKLS